jgi:hypothetical protein
MPLLPSGNNEEELDMMASRKGCMRRCRRVEVKLERLCTCHQCRDFMAWQIAVASPAPYRLVSRVRA